MERYFWNVLPQDRGHIVTDYYPQLFGAPEGESGKAKGLVVVADSSARDWSLYSRGVRIASGKSPIPDIEEAMRLRRASRH